MSFERENIVTARFAPGQVIYHSRFGYRGIIYDVDATYNQSPEWYEMMAQLRPSKQKPWYHVLVDGETHSTYVAEEFLLAADADDTVEHPMMDQLFTVARDGHIEIRALLN